MNLSNECGNSLLTFGKAKNDAIHIQRGPMGTRLNNSSLLICHDFQFDISNLLFFNPQKSQTQGLAHSPRIGVPLATTSSKLRGKPLVTRTWSTSNSVCMMVAIRS